MRARRRRRGAVREGSQSGRPDSNRGPRRPERRALPGCATPRSSISLAGSSGHGLEVAHRQARDEGLEGRLHPGSLALGPAREPDLLDVLALAQHVFDELGVAVAEVRADRVQARVGQRLAERAAVRCGIAQPPPRIPPPPPVTPPTVPLTAPPAAPTAPPTAPVAPLTTPPAAPVAPLTAPVAVPVALLTAPVVPLTT